MIRPVDSQVAIARTPEVAADRVRDIRMTGLTAGTLNEIQKDKEEEMRAVRDKTKDELEMLKVRPEDENKKNPKDEQNQKEPKSPQSQPQYQSLSASDRLLRLPVVSKHQTDQPRFDLKA